MNEPFFDDLTEAQATAVRHMDGPLLILAGAGSGKTRVVTCRMAHLILSGIPSANLLGLTFTNKAADEMRQRLASMVPLDDIWLSTFHRFCSRLLRHHAALVGLSENFSIFDTQDSLHALKSAVEGSDSTIIHYTPAQIARAISNAKNDLLGPDEYASRARSPLSTVTAEIYPLYQQRLLSSNAVDFDDLLLYTAKLLYENPELRQQLDDRFRYVLVDEYQDTNLAQYRIVRALSVDHPNLAVTGDPDQSIYGWRGANVRNILDFEKDYPDASTVTLEQNYRSTPNILQIANEVISHNVHRKPKSLYTDTPAGNLVRMVNYATNQEEAQQIAAGIAGLIRSDKYRAKDAAILYRTNALSRNLEHALRDEGIPYQIVNGVEFYKRKEIKDVLGYLQLANNPQNDIAFLRVINTPARGIGRKTLQRIEEFSRSNHCPMLAAIESEELLQSFSSRPGKALRQFVADFAAIRVAATSLVEELVGLVLSTTGYADQYKNSDTEEDGQRLANIQELLTAARQYDERNPDATGLDGFLEQTALVNDTDDWEVEADKATLMTLHSAKGMEFPLIFIVAVEHGILPHERSRDDLMSLEEERRLLFVGITRAQRELQISYVTHRDYRGKVRRAIPSEFLAEMPVHDMELLTSEPTSHRRQSESWDSRANNEWENNEVFADYIQDDPRPSQEVTESSRRPDLPNPVLTTAAEMLDDHGPSAAGRRAEPISPDLFELGMLVNHPDYGPGKMIALSGSSDKRTATVQFLNPPQTKKFRLAHSLLRPIASP